MSASEEGPPDGMKPSIRPGSSNGKVPPANRSFSETVAAGDPRRALGSRAEDICERQLLRAGWRILDRNWRVRMGEIDLVAMDGSTLVILEVKSHRAGNRAGPSDPVLAVGRQKQRRLRRLASAWLMTRCQGRDFEDLRFDVVGITFASDGSVTRYDHIRNAF